MGLLIPEVLESNHIGRMHDENIVRLDAEASTLKVLVTAA